HLPTAGAHGYRAHDVRSGQIGCASGAGSFLNQEVLTGLKREIRQRRDLPVVLRRRCVLHRPAVETDGRVAVIDEFNKIVREIGAGVAAAAIYLADDHVIGRRWRLDCQADRAAARTRLSIGDGELKSLVSRSGSVRYGRSERERVAAPGERLSS